MNFKPENEIIFSYKSGKHLQTILTLTNTSSTPNIFKVVVVVVSSKHQILIEYQSNLALVSLNRMKKLRFLLWLIEM